MNVDVIIIHGKNDDRAWAEQARASVAFHGVNIINVDAIPGDTRRARRNGFEKATASYVSFVDPDDYVVTDIPIFDLCVKCLEDDKSLVGVSTRSNILDVGTKRLPHILNHNTKWSFEKHFKAITLIHQLTVMRTELVQRICEEYHELIYPIKYNEHCRDLLLVQYGDWKIIPEIGYVWRKHSLGAHRIKMQKPREVYGKIYDIVRKKQAGFEV